jgi:hypothetical protein
MRFPWSRPKTVSPDEARDEHALHRFTMEMRTKLAQKRRQGRGGWWDSSECTVHELARQMIAVIEKGDPVDVANYCMMLYTRNGGHQALKMAWMLHMGETRMAERREKITAMGLLVLAAGGEIKVFPRHLHAIQGQELTTVMFEDPPHQLYRIGERK